MAKKGDKYTSPDGKTWVYTEGNHWREYVNGKPTNNVTKDSTPPGSIPGSGGAGGAAPTTYLTSYANEGGPPASNYITGKYEQYGRGGNGYLNTYAYTVPRVNRGDGGNGSTISSATVAAGSSGVVIIRFVVT